MKAEVGRPPKQIHVDEAPVVEYCNAVWKVSGARVRSELKFPKILEEGLAKTGVKAVWMEVTARVSSNGKPILVLDGVKPLAVETNRGILLGVEVKWPQPDWVCGVVKPVPAKEVFRVIGCDEKSCLTPLQEQVIRAAIATLQAPPFEAGESVATGIPGEYQFTA